MTMQTRSGHARSERRKLAFAIIGAGRVGMTLGRALRNSGHSINIALTRSAAGAKHAAKMLHTAGVAVGTRPIDRLSASHRQLLKQSDVLIIATPDDSIQRVADELAHLLQAKRPERRTASVIPAIAMHTSGALTSEVMATIRKCGVAIGSIHPLISISDQTGTDRSFSGVHFAFEGDAAAIRLGKKLVRDLGGDSFVIKAGSKPLYHAAALMASPNVTALLDVAIELMRHCGIPASRAREILLPLIRSTIHNLVHQTPRDALTGPFKRGDIETVSMHLTAIASERLNDVVRLYVALGKRSLKISNVSKATKFAIASALDKAESRSRRE